MAKWNDYTLKEKPADEDNIMISDSSVGVNKRVEFSGVFDWLSENLIEQGVWNSTINAGCVITSQGCNYYKIGKLVYVTAALWVNASSGTDEDVKISLPFPCVTARAYGTLGYFSKMGNFPQLKAAIIEAGSNNVVITYAPENGGVTNLKGNQMGNIQFSITYMAE